MKTRTSLLILSMAVAGLLAACNNHEAPNDTAIGDTAGTTPEGTTPAADTTAPYGDTAGANGAIGVQAGPITDTEFYRLAMDSSRKEIAASNLALEQSQDQAVKDFAQMMVTDHTAMSQRVAEAAGMADAAAPAPDPSATADLQGKTATDFDRAYASMMVTDHQKAVAVFENASDNASTDEAKMLAEDALPKLRDHLQRAQQLQQQYGSVSAMGDTAATGDATTNP